MDLVTALLTTPVGVGAGACVVVRARRRWARQRELERRIAELEVDLPLETGHLSPGLGSLAMGARTVRLLLETPLCRYDRALWRETPWRVRERLADYDAALCEARLALWQWTRSLARLEPVEIGVLRQLSLDPRPLVSLIYKPGVFDRSADVWDESLYPAEPNLELVTEELCAAMDNLRRFEVALLSHRPDPYR